MAYLIAAAAVIILGLSAIAAYYIIKLNQVKKAQAEQIKKNKAAWQKHRDELASDLRFIANAMLQGQCEITEGCLRIKVLMDRLDDELQHKPEFKTIQSHFAQTIQMPTHEAYKALSKQEQFKLDKTRYGLEAKNKDQILIEVQTLAEYKFDILQPN
ncbi:MAG: DUF2489 domain-containing protein [Gammaproteobacteria bacterium]|nr:DUF2489 domain-containing protein [Gammaproteobacteria bacterium]